MQPLITPITINKPSFRIGYNDRLVSIGSCFSENIGNYFIQRKFDCTVNPFGQQYNPVSIANSIQLLLDDKTYTADDLYYDNALYHSFDHHGSYSYPTADETINVINTGIKMAAAALKSASVLFITPGTAHVFVKKDDGRIVSNCHKISGSYFNRRLLSPTEIYTALSTAIKNVLQVNPTVQIVFTISPVRYFAFGAEDNTVSKAYLFTALTQLKEQFGLYYFPSYELMMDELRDYRFYSEDMLHPNYLATKYIWEKMTTAMMSDDTLKQMQQVEEILAAASHRPRNPESEQHRKFAGNTLDKIKKLKAVQPKLDFSKEEKILTMP